MYVWILRCVWTGVWIVRSNISRIGENGKHQFSNSSRIIENVEDLNFQYFQDRNKEFSIVVHIIAIVMTESVKMQLKILIF